MSKDITTLTEPPIVGETYIVPCVENDGTQTPWLTIPVLGAPHEDSALGFGPELHYHVDGRFTEREIHPLTIVLASKSRSPIIQREMKCFRSATRTPPVLGIFSHLYTAYRKASLPASMVCPHKGTCLKSMACTKEGVVVCPAHGLAWNINDGRNVTRDVDWPSSGYESQGPANSAIPEDQVIQRPNPPGFKKSHGISEDELFDKKYGNPYRYDKKAV